MSAATAPRVAIVDSGCANVASVAYAFERLRAEVVVTDQASVIESASHVVLPGVGTAQAFMANLRAADLTECVRRLRRPCLGICLGMQLMFGESEEGNTQALGLFPGRVKKLPGGRGITVPHMGWNQLAFDPAASALLEGVTPSDYAYFVHSYYVPASDLAVATTTHGVEITAVVSRDNFYGCQFHPERSAGTGATVLRNFLELS